MIPLIFIALAGVFKAVADTLVHHFDKSVFKNLNPNKWNALKSWSAKWKNGNPDEGEAFPGSSTIFVVLTDWWHRFDLLRIISFCLAVGFSSRYEWNFYVLAGFSLLVFLIAFNITYYSLYKR